MGCLLAALRTSPILSAYTNRRGTPILPPVVLIHGILGSRLTDSESGQEIWYGNIGKLAFSDYSELALQIDPETLEPLPTTLVTSGLAAKVAGRDFYANIQEILESAGGYKLADIGSPREKGERVYYVFAYDWRQDNANTASKLVDFVTEIRKDFDDDSLKVDLVAHSMGGLIARYFMRYGKTDVLDDNDFPVNYSGAHMVRKAILLGTPNLGSVSSLHAFIKGFKVGMRPVPTEVFATMPSTYQLFPHALHDWLLSEDGTPINEDIFDVETWHKVRWSIFDPKVRKRIIGSEPDEASGQKKLETLERYFEKRLERARRFVWSLTVPVPDAEYRLIVFGGDCQLTPARLLLESVEGGAAIRLWPDEVDNQTSDINYDELMLEPGDGTVTKASLLARDILDPSVRRHRYIDFPLDYSLFLCERHNRMTGNLTFQDNLLHVLLSQD